MRVAHSLGGKLERRLDIVSGQLRVSFDGLLERVAVGDTADDDGHWDARSLDTWITVMDRWIEDNSFTPTHKGSHK